jgi:hypothetical protein
MLDRCDRLREYSDHLARSNNGITPIDRHNAGKTDGGSSQSADHSIAVEEYALVLKRARAPINLGVSSALQKALGIDLWPNLRSL